MLQLRDKKYILIMVILLILSIFILILTNTKHCDQSEPYKKKANKILVILVGDFPLETEKLARKNYDIVEFNAPADISPEHWNELAMAIFKSYQQYDAFVILHSPETITYTASALSFMLENLNKTVILGSDGVLTTNLAKNYRIPEVVICDGERIIRGCRARRMKNIINSPSYPYLGKNDGKIELDKAKILPPPSEPLKFLPVDPNKKIIVFKMFPGVDSKYLLGALKEQKVHGIILESYHGGFVGSDPKFIKLIANAIENGIYVVTVSQNAGDITDKSLEQVGAVCTGNITTEAALAKLYMILTNVEQVNRDMIHDLMAISMRGEI